MDSEDVKMKEMIEEVDRLHMEISTLLEKSSAFEIINAKEELLIYQMDFHGGLSLMDAEEIFNKMYFKIMFNLRSGVYHSNTAFKNQHIIKVICGYGHHSKEKDPALKGKLK